MSSHQLYPCPHAKWNKYVNLLKCLNTNLRYLHFTWLFWFMPLYTFSPLHFKQNFTCLSASVTLQVQNFATKQINMFHSLVLNPRQCVQHWANYTRLRFLIPYKDNKLITRSKGADTTLYDMKRGIWQYICCSSLLIWLAEGALEVFTSTMF